MSEGQGQDPGKGPERPSFESWWKKSKEVLKTRKITFVQAANLSGEEHDVPESQNPQDKAKARRAQVRKAQIEHRQRKANYVKQLEIDVARIRDMITAAQMETCRLQAENHAIRSRIAGAAALPSQLLPPDQDMIAGALPAEFDMSFLDDIQVDSNEGLTMSLGMDAVMNLPVYQISGETTSSNNTAPTYFPSDSALNPELSQCPFTQLSFEQTQRVINFILALEQICWDHFHPSNFQPDIEEPFGTESGHTLMATSLALRTAPESVFDAMRSRPLPPPQPPAALAALQAATAGLDVQTPPSAISWPASGLTLHSLYGLANSIFPTDLDLAPVQAWFELAERYPLEILLRQDVEDRLKREFVGVVKCPHYGAAIERGAFESICARVIDPEVGRVAHMTVGVS